MTKELRSAPRLAAPIFLIASLLTLGLAATRLLYEGLFPRLLWLARPLAVLPLSLTLAVAGWWLWSRWVRDNASRRDSPAFVSALAPLFLNLLYLFDPSVNLVRSRFLFALGVWLTAVLVAMLVVSARSWRWLGLASVALALLPLYVIPMSPVVGSADTFEFQVVIPQLGIAHPTGYPLYLLLGRLFALLPVGSMAWRVNLASVVFAVLAAFFVYAAGLRLLQRPLPALLAALVLGLTPTFWSQAIVAEVYALHALIVAASLWAMIVLLNPPPASRPCAGPRLSWLNGSDWRRMTVFLALLLGLGLANHLTTLFLIPPALLALAWSAGPCLRRQERRANLRLLAIASAAFLAPLLLYAYLPLRWQALHGEAMGVARFVDWVAGGRFQGALQLNAWLTDFTRYQVVGRLLLQNWGWPGVCLTLLGGLYLAARQRRTALVLFVAGLGFAFYAVNYYVPDLAVFLIPAHVVVALFWAGGLAAVLAAVTWLSQRVGRPGWAPLLTHLLVVLVAWLALAPASEHWPATDRTNRELLAWGEGVLALPLDSGAAILADSEKIAPLYYLQQAEGVRPDLAIMVLPDEAAYRAELDARLASGQTVYLARFLPGLEGIYHLRSKGPLIEVSSVPLTALPSGTIPANLSFGALRLAGYNVQEEAAVDSQAAAVTLYWQADAPTSEPLHVYLRWAGAGEARLGEAQGGQHPAGNTYPTVAWRPGEIVADFHLLPRPLSPAAETVQLQVAVASPFTAEQALDWQTVAELTLSPSGALALPHAMRAQNGRVLLSGASFPAEARPGMDLPVVVSGFADRPQVLAFELRAAGAGATAAPVDGFAPVPNPGLPFSLATEVEVGVPPGRYDLVSRDAGRPAVCGWLQPAQAACALGAVTVSGLALPDDAANFEDKIALLDIEVPNDPLVPGEQLPVRLRWQSLSRMDEDYTVFLQVLDAQDRLVGQVDAWPLQGTYPTSQWRPGEVIDDPYLIQLSASMPPGSYRLQVGFYLLSTLRRLPVLDASGQAVDDKVVLSGLQVP